MTFSFLFSKSKDENWIKTANRIIPPPIKVNDEGLSLANKNAHIGPRTDSDSIITPTIAEVVLRAPIVMNIKPKPTWKKPAKKPKNISLDETIKLCE